jgi:hypothetical protein
VSRQLDFGLPDQGSDSGQFLGKIGQHGRSAERELGF